ncbi:unnamed protein product [Phyllotreta striolata]|uniref:Uncharacterized protein n=1 Tax=Phyllotreta striolata TaxID=444603 RepID=A0A9N9XM75_PHYSR|nr:unnamed protein product [Phyllotreta striolata]
MDVLQFQDVIAGYERVIAELTGDLRSVQAAHDELRASITILIEENRELAKELKGINAKRGKESSIEFELVDNLRQQLNLVLEEKEEIKLQLQQTSGNVDLLENELKLYKSDNVELIPKQQYMQTKHALNNAINQLKQSLKQSEDKQTKTVEDTLKKDEEINNLTHKLDDYKRKIHEAEETNEELRRNFYEKERRMQTLLLQNNEHREKVNEALQIVQAALNEKDAALMREVTVRTNVQKLNEELDSILNDIKEKFDRETARIKQEASKQRDALLKEIDSAKQRLDAKSIEIEKFHTKSIVLQNNIDKLLSTGSNANAIDDNTATSKLLVLEKNLESTFQKLLVSEKHNIQLKSDLEALKNDMEQMGVFYERTLKSKDVEKSSLQNTINQLQAFVRDKDLSVKSLSEEVRRLSEELAANKHELKTYAERVDRELDEAKKKIKEWKNAVESTEKLNKKLLVETKEILNRMDEALRRSKSDGRKLRKDLVLAQRTVEEYKRKAVECREMMRVLTVDFNNVDDNLKQNILS